MRLFKCFDIVNMSVECASEEFGELYEVDAEKLRILKQYCDGLDKLADEFGEIAISADVDRSTKHIIIIAEYILISPTYSTANHMLLQLIARSNCVEFFNGNEGACIRFDFPSVWNELEY